MSKLLKKDGAKPPGTGGAGDDDAPAPEKALTAEAIAAHISLLARTGNGLSHAYTRLEVHSKGITNIDILGESYPHLRYLDLSDNLIKDISCLHGLEYLLSVNFQNNRVRFIPAALDKRKYLQQGNFAENKLESIDIASWPLCLWLNLNQNKLTNLRLAEFLELRHLEVRANQLTTTAGLNTPKLKELYMAANLISEIGGLQDKQHLTVLHLRGNQIESLDGFSEGLKNLETINLRENKIADPDEIEKLNVLPNLKNLSLNDNPVSEIDTYRLEVVYRLPRLVKLDKDPITSDEKEDADNLRLERLAEAHSRAEEEAAQRAAKELAARGEEGPEGGGVGGGEEGGEEDNTER